MRGRIAKINEKLKQLLTQKGQGLTEFVLILAFCAAIGYAAHEAGFGKAISSLLDSGEQPEYVTAAIGGGGGRVTPTPTPTPDPNPDPDHPETWEMTYKTFKSLKPSKSDAGSGRAGQRPGNRWIHYHRTASVDTKSTLFAKGFDAGGRVSHDRRPGKESGV